MVRSMLAFARKTPATDGNVDLNGLTGEVVRLLERTTLARVRLTLDLDGELRPIRGDADALAQALMNLCINAVDAMEGAGALNLATLNLDGGWVELRVEDSGCGMPPEVLERALTPYYTTKEEGRGTGLGLALVYSTVKAHGGELALESAPGAGTRVRLRFPGVAAPSAGSAPAAAPPAAIRPLRVLLVDDDELVLRATAMLLGTLGHTATTAATGEEALECLARGLDPEVVILDMNMPGLGGHGTLPRLRALRPDLPVLLATGRADQKAVDLVAAHARVSLLPKPYALEDLNRCLGDLA